MLVVCHIMASINMKCAETNVVYGRWSIGGYVRRTKLFAGRVILGLRHPHLPKRVNPTSTDMSCGSQPRPCFDSGNFIVAMIHLLSPRLRPLCLMEMSNIRAPPPGPANVTGGILFPAHDSVSGLPLVVHFCPCFYLENGYSHRIKRMVYRYHLLNNILVANYSITPILSSKPISNLYIYIMLHL